MTQILRQSTQIKVVIGPVVAVGDGFTPVTTLSLGSADEAEIIKSDAGSVTDISGATFAAITSADGYYNLTLSTSHTDTVGLLTVLINDDSLCLPVKATFQVIEEAIYDALYAASATGLLPANVTQFGGSNGTFSGGRPEVNTTHWGGAAVASAVVKADLETIKTQDVTCAAGVTVLASVGTAATSTAQTGDSYAIVNDGTNGNAAIKTQVAAIETDTQDIQSRIPAALVGGRMDCTIDGTGMENGAVDAILNRDASGSTTNGTLGAIINDLEDGGRLDLLIDDIQSLATGNDTYLSDLNVRIPAALTGDGNMKTDVLRINGQLTSAAGTITFPGTIASTTNITGGTITTVTTTTNLTNAPTSGDFTATMKLSIETALGTALAGTDVTDFTAIPAGTPNILEALGFLYAQGFYRKEQTATTTTLYDGDNNAVAEATTSDNGTTFVRTRFTAP